VRDLLNIHTGAISVDPGGTIATIPLVVHPFLIFMATLVLLQSNEASLSFWRQLALTGGAFAAFGLVQHFVSPGSSLEGEELDQLNRVTRTFVNSNSAVTLFGVATLLIAGIIVRLAQHLYLQREPSQAAPQTDVYENRITLIMYVGLFGTSILALFLTGSSDDYASTLPSLTLIAGWFAFSGRRRIGIAGTAASVLFLTFAVLGALSLFQFVHSGFNADRWCVFRSTLSAIADYPWFGTGFGTFRNIFPVYRSPECGIDGVLDHAHNSFLEGYLGMGFPFAVFALFVLFYLMYLFRIGYRTRHRFRIIPLTGMAMSLLIVLHGLMDFSLQVPGVAAYIAAALGTAVSVSVARRQSARDFS
jgi:O-antigen ligase